MGFMRICIVLMLIVICKKQVVCRCDSLFTNTFISIYERKSKHGNDYQ